MGGGAGSGALFPVCTGCLSLVSEAHLAASLEVPVVLFLELDKVGALQTVARDLHSCARRGRLVRMRAAQRGWVRRVRGDEGETEREQLKARKSGD